MPSLIGSIQHKFSWFDLDILNVEIVIRMFFCYISIFLYLIVYAHMLMYVNVYACILCQVALSYRNCVITLVGG